MAKSAAERKAAQRKRQKESGETKIEIIVDIQELNMLKENCILRRPGRESYNLNEYIGLLIRQDDIQLKKQLKKLEGEKCAKCNDPLPVQNCCLSGDSQCWTTFGHRDFSINIVKIKYQ